jgi:ribosome biogenesis GTPase
LVTAEAYGIETVLVFNKIDTLDEATLDEQLYLQHIYQEIGYQCLRVSSTEMKGIEVLKELMIGKVSMFSGHSGVGKSTLVNALEPNLQLKTKVISEQSMQGQHTTTFAEMYDLPSGGRIIDTPGMREFAIADIAKDELSHYFPEMKARLQDCQFNNCVHINEPGCAIKKAVVKGEIHEERYVSYLSILDSIADKQW